MFAGIATATTMGTTFAVLALITTSAAVAATRVRPAHDPETVEHEHHDLDPDHQHLQDAVAAGGAWKHAHPYRIDDHHRHWPR
jgi:hypothetical protein